MRAKMLQLLSIALIAVAAPFAQAYDQIQVTQVDSWYRRYLGRPAEPEGMANHLNLLNHMPAVQVEAGILASQEYALRTGYSDVGFLTGLYRDVIGAVATPQQINQDAYRLHQLGNNRQAFASEFLQTHPVRSYPAFVPAVASSAPAPVVYETPAPGFRLTPPPINAYRPTYGPPPPPTYRPAPANRYVPANGYWPGARQPNYGLWAYHR